MGTSSRANMRNQSSRGWPQFGTGAVAALTVLTTCAPTTFAAQSASLKSTAALATASSVVWSAKNIEFTTYTADRVSSYVEHGTTYMPVWYVLQALKESGYTVSFNGSTLNISSPQNVFPNTTGLSIGAGNLSIQINGQLVKQVVSEVRPDPAGGQLTQYLPIYYIQQILSALSFYNAWNGSTWTGRSVKITMQGNTSLAQGQMAAFSLEFQNPDGTYFIPDSPVTWSVTGTGAQIDKNTGLLTAITPGTYNVTGSVDGFHWTKQVSVFGQAVGLRLSASKPFVVPDGTSTNTITVQAVDAYGNVVTNFTGSVELSIPSSGGSFVGGIPNGALNQVTTYLYNGVGTATMTAPSFNPQTAEPITTSGLSSVSQDVPSNFQYRTLSIVYGVPVVSKIGISSNVSTLSSSTNNTASLTFTLNDADGNPISYTGISGMNVTLTIEGPASFASGATVTTTTLYVYPGSTGVSIPIYALTGQSGQVTVTASGEGVEGSVTLNSNTALS